MTPTHMLTGAVVVLAALLPFIAVYHLDGIVQIVRGNGVKALISAFVLSVVVGVIGFVVLQYASGQPEITPATMSSMNSLATYFLAFSVPLAVILFIGRTVKLLRAGPGSARRTPKPASR